MRRPVVQHPQTRTPSKRGPVSIECIASDSSIRPIVAGCSCTGVSAIPRATQLCGNEDAMCAVVRSVRAGLDKLNRRRRSGGQNRFAPAAHTEGTSMNRLIYIIGAVVVIIAVLSFFGLR